MSQIEALTRSIEDKWVGVVNGTHSSDGPHDCVCCIEYYDDSCLGCPIGRDSGPFCTGSPHGVYASLKSRVGLFGGGNYNYDLMFDLKAAAQMELDYLIDLRNRLFDKMTIEVTYET